MPRNFVGFSSRLAACVVRYAPVQDLAIVVTATHGWGTSVALAFLFGAVILRRPR